MEETRPPRIRSQTTQNPIQRKESIVNTRFKILLAVTTVFALFTAAIAHDGHDGMTMLEIAAGHGYNPSHPVTLVRAQTAEVDYATATMQEIAASQGINLYDLVTLIRAQTAEIDYATATMQEIAASQGINLYETVTLTDLPQFSDATIGNLTKLARLVANTYFEGDVVAACNRLAYVFESIAQHNRVISVLLGS